MLIYFAAPLFSQAERAFNLHLTEKLEERGLSVFLPQRDGVEFQEPRYSEMTLDEIRQEIFETDRDKVIEADILLIILDGRVPDEGACIELGLAYEQKHLQQRDKFLIGLHTDSRPAFLRAKLNPMVHGALDYISGNEDDLLSTLEDYCANRSNGR